MVFHLLEGAAETESNALTKINKEDL